MKKYILPVFALLCASGVYAAEPQNGSGETNGYRLVWQDLFDGGVLRADRWNIEVNGDGGGNSELQYYTDREQNVRVGDDGEGNGCLILTAIREEYNNRHFTSGRIQSKNKTHFTHGKVEASIKFPVTNAGLWPAFWMMGNDFDQVGWPKCGETDIIEMGHQNGIRNNVSDRFFNGASHWGTAWNKTGDYARDKTLDYSLQDGKFHLVTCIWDDNSVAMYIDLDKYPDQQPYYKMDIPGTKEDVMWPGNYFHKSNFILFNLAVGGHFPGIYKAEEITALNNGNSNRASMYVNYVKVYQKGDDSETLTTQAPGDAENLSGVSIAEAEQVSWSVRAGMISVAGSEGIILYDLSGKAVASTDHASLSTEGIPSGIYVARSGSATRKIAIP